MCIYIYMCVCVSADPSLQQGERVRERLPIARRQEAFSPHGQLLLVFFLDRSESDVRPSNRAAARSLPSFTAMLLKRGQGSVFPSWRLLLAFFLDRSESGVRPSDRAAARSLPSFTATVFFFNLIFVLVAIR